MAINPDTKTFITTAQNTYGLDPGQEIDVNDPMTKLTLSIILTNIEQGRNIYSYDQFIKGIAKSIGLAPDEFDKNVNATSLGFENNSGSQGFVSPASNGVKQGGSSINLATSTYVNATILTGVNFNTTTFTNSGLLSTGITTTTGSIAGIGVATPFSGSQGSFYNTVYDKVYFAAVAAGAPNPSVLAKVAAGQAALETGYGKSAYDNNVFNITGSGDAGSRVRGDTNAAGQPITQSFAKYSSLDSAAAAYVKLIGTATRYKDVYNATNTASAVTALGKSGYAEDPNYAAKVLTIVNKSNVTVQSQVLGAVPTAPLGYDGTDVKVTKNSDGSYTFEKPTGEKTTVQTDQSFQAQRPPGWETAQVTENQDSNKNTISYTLTKTNEDGTKSQLVQYNDGSKFGRLVDPKTGETYDPTKGGTININGDIETTNILPPVVKLAEAPANESAGVPSTALREITQKDGQFESVTYKDALGNPIKTIDKNGNVYDSTGNQTTTNYFGGEQTISGFGLKSETIGLPPDYRKIVDVNDNGVITNIKFLDGDGQVVRSVNPNNGIVSDAGGNAVGYVNSSQVTDQESVRRALESTVTNAYTGEETPAITSTTAYSYTSVTPTVTTPTVDRVTGDNSTNSGQTTTNVQSNSNTTTYDPAIQQLEDRRTTLIEKRQAIDEYASEISIEKSKITNALKDDSLTDYERQELADRVTDLSAEEYVALSEFRRTNAELGLIDKKLADPEGYTPTPRELEQIDQNSPAIDNLNKVIDPIQEVQVVTPLVGPDYIQPSITIEKIYGIYPEQILFPGTNYNSYTGVVSQNDADRFGVRTLPAISPDGTRQLTPEELGSFKTRYSDIEARQEVFQQQAAQQGLSPSEYLAQNQVFNDEKTALIREANVVKASSDDGASLYVGDVRSDSTLVTRESLDTSIGTTGPEPEVPGDLSRFVAEEKYGTTGETTSGSSTVINDPSPTLGYDNGFENAINPAGPYSEQQFGPGGTTLETASEGSANLPVFAQGGAGYGDQGGGFQTGVSGTGVDALGDSNSYNSNGQLGFGLSGGTATTPTGTTNVGGGNTIASGTSPAGGSTTPGGQGSPAPAGANAAGMAKGC